MIVLVLREMQPLLLDVDQLPLCVEIGLGGGEVLPEHVLLKVAPFLLTRILDAAAANDEVGHLLRRSRRWRR
jgi:hypothetical protein